MLNPLHDRVVIKRLAAETVSIGGILIPGNAAEKPEQGEVLAVGPGKRNNAGDIIPMSVEIGEKVLFGKHSGQTVKVKGEEILVLREDEIMGILE